MNDRSAEFIALAQKASGLAERASDLDTAPLEALETAAELVGRAWSGSSLGYQANVYYAGFQAPPPGAMFSREWGFLGMAVGTTGDWQIFTAEQVIERVEGAAKHPDLSGPNAQSEAVRSDVERLIQQARSLAAKIPKPHDDFLKETLESLSHISLPTFEMLCRAQMQGVTGQIIVRDMQAAEGGFQAAGHQMELAKVRLIRAPYAVAERLAKVCEGLGYHLEGEGLAGAAVLQLGNTVFLGHGGASSEYLKLGVWLGDNGLEWEVFDRKPTAGMSTKERLSEMLDNARIAFLLMTPEDEAADGKVKARDNVIHEVGLFQGRLGWKKAIVLLEEGCEEFSNIEGLGQVRYPKGNVSAAFDEIRQVLVREGLL